MTAEGPSDASRGSIALGLPRHITLIADMHGCPNQCRHCYLGQATPDRLSADHLRGAAVAHGDPAGAAAGATRDDALSLYLGGASEGRCGLA